MKKSILSIAIISVGLSIGCKTDEEKYHVRLEGTWNIVSSQRTLIYSDGSVDLIEDLNDAGTITISEDQLAVGDESKSYSMSYQNVNGNSFSPSGLMSADENRTRIFFYAALCRDIFGCDLIWTVEKETKNKQVWATYFDSDQVAYSRDWDPSDDSYHQRWVIELEKE